MTAFVEAVVDNEPDQLEEEVVEGIEAAFEDWSYSPANLDYWLIKAFVRISSLVRDQAAVLSRAAFKKFGETIVKMPPILAAPATVTSTWTMIDDLGHEIPDGTLVRIPVSGDKELGFKTVGAVVVKPGDTETAEGEVLLEAVKPGEVYNKLTENARLDTALSFVLEGSIELTEATKGGVDEEEEDAYLVRLTESLQLLSLSLIVQRDFEIDARAISGVARALCLPAYNLKEEKAAALCVTVIPIDEEGKALSAEKQEELQARQQAKVPDEVLVFVGESTYTGVDAETKVEVLPGYDGPSVVEAVEARLGEYFSPANWGLPANGDSSNSSGWDNKLTVYYLEVVSEIDRVPGVARVVSLKIAEAGKALGTVDVALEGIAALAEPGKITVSAS